MQRIFILCCYFLWLTPCLHAQKVSNLAITQQGNELDVSFHLEGTEKSYLVKLDWAFDEMEFELLKEQAFKPGNCNFHFYSTEPLFLPNCIFRVSAEVEIIDPDSDFTFVEQDPQPPGGDLQAYFAKNIRYPQKAINQDVEGRVFVTFVITSSGEVDDVRLLKGIGYGCDEEAIRVVKSMPQWVPGKNVGSNVKVRMNIPIVFKLSRGDEKDRNNTNQLNKNRYSFPIE
jgi:TonB family protein